MITTSSTVTPATICQSNPEFFDAVGLSESGAEQADRNAAVEGVLDALEACTHCPLLAACRETTQRDIDCGVPPVHAVRAGVFWGLNGRPDPTLAGALDQPSARALAAECADAIPETVTRDDGRSFPQTVVIPRRGNVRDDEMGTPDPVVHPVALASDRVLIGWDASWAQLRSASSVNRRAIDLMLSEQRDDWGRVVTRLYLDQYSKARVDGREVAEDADVCIAIREGINRGISRRSLCARLSIGEDKLEEIMRLLGLEIIRSPRHQRYCDKRALNRRVRELETERDAIPVPASGDQWTLF